MKTVGLTFIVAVLLVGVMCVADTPIRTQFIDTKIAEHEAAIKVLAAEKRKMADDEEKTQRVSTWALKKAVARWNTEQRSDGIYSRIIGNGTIEDIIEAARKLDEEINNKAIVAGERAADTINYYDHYLPLTTEWWKCPAGYEEEAYDTGFSEWDDDGSPSAVIARSYIFSGDPNRVLGFRSDGVVVWKAAKP